MDTNDAPIITTMTMSENPILWQPGEERVKGSAMYRFMRAQGFDNYDDLFQWSITELSAFWQAVCQFCDVHFDTPSAFNARSRCSGSSPEPLRSRGLG